MYSKRKKLTKWELTKLWLKRLRFLWIPALIVCADRIYLMWKYWGEDTHLAMKIIYAETVGSMVEWGSLLVETIVVVGGAGIAIFGLIVLGMFYCYQRKERYEKKEFLLQAQDLLDPYANQLIEKIKNLTETHRLFVNRAIARFQELQASKELVPVHQVIGQSYQEGLLGNNQEWKTGERKPEKAVVQEMEVKSEQALSSQKAAAPAAEIKQPGAFDNAGAEEKPASSKQGMEPGPHADQAPGQTFITPPEIPATTTYANITTHSRNDESGIVEIRRDLEEADAGEFKKADVEECADPLPAGQDQPPGPVKVDRPWFLSEEKREIPLEVRNEVRALAGLPPLTEPPEKQKITADPVDQGAAASGQRGSSEVVESHAENGLSEQQPGDRDELVTQQNRQGSHENDESISHECGSRGNNPLVTAIIRLMETRDVWKGSPTELWDALENLADDRSKKSQDWPQGPVWIIRKLNDIDQDLMEVKLIWATGRSNQGRWCMISRNDQRHDSI